jgi:hypothetical protein
MLNRNNEFKGLSIRALVALGTFSLKLYSKKYHINNSDLDEFIDLNLKLLTAEDLLKWNNEFNSVEITGLGDPFPIDLVEKYPEHSLKLDLITQNIREISASQIYGSWNSDLTYKLLYQVQELCDIEINREVNLNLFKEHNPGTEGWGTIVSENLVGKWLIQLKY